jgi:hypothetical protein
MLLTFRRQKYMIEFFSGLAWTFNLLPGKHTEICIWHATPFVRTF